MTLRRTQLTGMAVTVALLLTTPFTRADTQTPDATFAEIERIAQTDASRAIEQSERLLANAVAEGNVADEAAAHRLIAIARYFQADFPRSLESAIKAERLYAQLGNLNRQASVLSLIGSIHGSSRRFDRALQVYERAYRVSGDAGSDSGQAIVLMNLGKTHYDLGNYAKSLDHYERSLALHLELQASGERLRPDALLFARMGIADALLRRGNLDPAIERVRAVLAEADEATLIYQNALSILGEALLMRGELAEAETQLERALAEAERTQRPAKQVDVLGLLAQLAVKRGDHERALTLQRSVIDLNLGIYDERNSEELARLEARYENDLREQKIRLQALEIQRNRLWLFTVTAVAVTSLLLVGVVFSLYRAKWRANRVLQALAETDPLTGLYNRRSMSTFLGELDEDARAGSAVCVIDLDDFKKVNDQYGHEVGDQLLVKVAQTIASALRSTDRVARWGGEEFLAALTGRTSENALMIARRLCEQIQSIRFEIAPGKTVNASASLGLAYFSDELDANEVVRRADQAMYEAKANGKNQTMVFAGD